MYTPHITKIDAMSLAMALGIDEETAMSHLLKRGHQLYTDPISRSSYSFFTCPLSKEQALALGYGEKAALLIEFYFAGASAALLGLNEEHLNAAFFPPL